MKPEEVSGEADKRKCSAAVPAAVAGAYRRSFGVRVGLGFRGRLRDLVDVGRVNAVDWSDRRLVL